MKTNEIGKSAEAYLLAAAVELCPIECRSNIETVGAWMRENAKAIAERASAKQAEFMNRFFKSEAIQEEAKRILCGQIWRAAQ